MSRVGLAALGLAVFFVNGCSGDGGGGSSACVPEQTLPCTCAPGESGIQTCTVAGAYGACVCGIGGNAAGTTNVAGQGTSGTGVAGSGTLDAGDVTTLPDGAMLAADGGMALVTGPGSVVTDPSDEAALLWDDAELRTYELTIAQTDLDTMNADPSAEVYVPATFKGNGETVSSVGVRYKGSVGAFVSCGACLKRSMKVSFDWQLPDQRFHGLKKINFHAMNDDTSLMRDRLGYSLFREMGIAAPRCVHARLLINGKFAGLFSLVEELDGRFADSHFTAKGDGNLYKEVWPKWTDATVYPPSLRSNRSDPMVSFDRVTRFAQGLEAAADDAAVLVHADQWMDADYVMSYIAVDRTIQNDDGIFHWYCNTGSTFTGYNPGPCSNHNYYWYEEAGFDRLWLVAWDVTLALKGETSVTRIVDQWNDTSAACEIKSNGSGFADQQTAPACDKLTHAWATRSAEYKAALKRFLDGPFADAAVSAKLTAWQAQIMPVVMEASMAGHQPNTLVFPQRVTALKTAIADLRAAAQTRAQ